MAKGEQKSARRVTPMTTETQSDCSSSSSNSSSRPFTLPTPLSSSHESFSHCWKRLQQLELWRELAVRPGPDDCHPDDHDLLEHEHDDIQQLERRCLQVRQTMNKHSLPPHELSLDTFLTAAPSTIPNAGKGLFNDATLGRVIAKGETLCYYCGHIHNFLSTKHLAQDKSYLMLVSGELFVDPGPCPQIKARYINDPLNEAFLNCEYVPEPQSFRCAVVATKTIHPGEEVFGSYGEAYWSQHPSQGIVFNGIVNRS